MTDSLRQEATGGLVFYQSPLLAAFPELRQMVSRHGGVSLAPYDSLNLSFSVGDRRDAVGENRRLVQQALGLDFLASATQVHGSQEAVVVGNAGAPTAELAAADILLSDRPGVGLLIKQADCQAVALYDPVRRVVANVHCGWRGQVQNVLGEAVARLQERFACRPADLYAALSPSLGPCCAEFLNFRREFPPRLWSYQDRPNYFDPLATQPGPTAGRRPPTRKPQPGRTLHQMRRRRVLLLPPGQNHRTPGNGNRPLSLKPQCAPSLFRLGRQATAKGNTSPYRS